jgi:hypothetical protein
MACPDCIKTEFNLVELEQEERPNYFSIIGVNQQVDKYSLTEDEDHEEHSFLRENISGSNANPSPRYLSTSVMSKMSHDSKHGPKINPYLY